MPSQIQVNPPASEHTTMKQGVQTALTDLGSFADGSGALTTAQLTAAIRKMAGIIAKIIRYIARKEGWL